MEKEIYELKNDLLIIHLPEELDHHFVNIIREKTDELFTCKKIRNVIFDFMNTSFMDSSGIGLIMGRYKEVKYLNGKVYVTNVCEKMEKIIQISGIYRFAQKCECIDDVIFDEENY